MISGKPKVGVVAVGSTIESGAERYEEVIAGATSALAAAGLDVTAADGAVYTTKEALDACDKFKAAQVESLVMIDLTWVCDSLKYVFINELKVPTAFWAVPYTETFSISCVQNFGQALHTEGIHYEYVYGLPSDASLIEKLRRVAIAGQIVKGVRSLRIALAGSHQTWRVAGAQDMKTEEWQFSRALGSTIVHMEMNEITDEAKKISDEEARGVYASLKDRTGVVKCTDDTMLWMTKVYLAVKSLMQEHSIDIVAAECYPNFGCLMNQPSSWIEDEGLILDTEGDIGNSLVKYILNAAAGGGATALAEPGSFSDEENFIALAHEGSTPASLAADLSQVQVAQAGDPEDLACAVGFPLKPMDKVTIGAFQGVAGDYQMLISTGSVLKSTHQEWLDVGEKLLAKVRFDNVLPSEELNQAMAAGLHHHVVIKEGDVTDIAAMACKYLGVKVVQI